MCLKSALCNNIIENHKLFVQGTLVISPTDRIKNYSLAGVRLVFCIAISNVKYHFSDVGFDNYKKYYSILFKQVDHVC